MADTDAANIASHLQYMLTVRHRPLRLILDGVDGTGEEPLLPQRVIGSEAICGGLEFRILCVS